MQRQHPYRIAAVLSGRSRRTPLVPTPKHRTSASESHESVSLYADHLHNIRQQHSVTLQQRLISTTVLGALRSPVHLVSKGPN